MVNVCPSFREVLPVAGMSNGLVSAGVSFTFLPGMASDGLQGLFPKEKWQMTASAGSSPASQVLQECWYVPTKQDFAVLSKGNTSRGWTTSCQAVWRRQRCCGRWHFALY